MPLSKEPSGLKPVRPWYLGPKIPKVESLSNLLFAGCSRHSGSVVQSLTLDLDNPLIWALGPLDPMLLEGMAALVPTTSAFCSIGRKVVHELDP